MATSFPTSLDNYTNPSASDFLNTAGMELDVKISNLNDAVEALEAKVGAANAVRRGGSPETARVE